MALNNQEDQALALMRGDGAPIAEEVMNHIDDLYAYKTDIGLQRSDEYGKITSNTIAIMVVTVIVAVVIAFVWGVVISRSISKPLHELVGAAELIAEGDLNVKIRNNSADETGMLARAFRKMASNLNEIMSNINAAAEQVAVGSKQVSDSSIALSQGATEQASVVEELTASLEEISTQTSQNAQNANEANGLAETVKANAMHGNDQMQEMLKAMEEINSSSNSISKIIKVIDDIAFQTNILALNAAVEAARAGQHGKGFAVVAEEVRNLAARSADAAKETTAMIEGSIKKVDEGTKIANATANALSSIVEGINKVASLVGEIAVASNEQAAGIAQVNQGILQVSEVVQTTSSTSEESAAASEELATQAEKLREQVARFKLQRMSSFEGEQELEELNPEVLKMLEQMDKAKANSRQVQAEVAATSHKKIALSDKEFGKY